MPKDSAIIDPPDIGDNGSVPVQPYLNRLPTATSDAENRVLDNVFTRIDVETVERFERMYAKKAIVDALDALKISIRWELRQLRDIVQSKKSSGDTKIRAMEKVEAIRSFVFDARPVSVNHKKREAGSKEPKEVSTFMREEADTAADKWEPKEDGG